MAYSQEAGVHDPNFFADWLAQFRLLLESYGTVEDISRLGSWL